MDKKIKAFIGRTAKGKIVEVNKYDMDGNITYVMSHTEGFTMAREVTYDEHGNSIREVIRKNAEIVIDITNEYEYDSKGNIIKDTATGEGPNYVYKYTYDKKGRLYTERKDDNCIKYHYYDDNDNEIRVISTFSDTVSEYDKNNNLIHFIMTVVKEDGTREVEFEYWHEYDDNSNMIHYKSDTLETFCEYDKNGNLIMERNIHFEPDEESNIIRYEYDSENRRIKESRTDLNNNPTDPEIFYEYFYY